MNVLSSMLRLLIQSKTPSIRKKSRVLFTKGVCYDLQSIYQELNQAYFSGGLDLKISWSGSASQPARRSRRLGVYNFKTKQIRIHRLLDQHLFPSYFISFVVYHEMLHSVFPPIKKVGKRYQIHHREFKMKEREFEHYSEVKRWEKENKKLFFNRPLL